MRTSNPIHPGETLKEDFMDPYQLSANKLAHLLGMPQDRVRDILCGRRGMTEDTALRLEKVWGVSAQFWLTLQQQYDRIVAAQKATNPDPIERISATTLKQQVVSP